MGLSQILADENGKFDVNVRVAAGLAAKNCLVARDMYRRQQLIESFKVIDPSIKTKIKALVKFTFFSMSLFIIYSQFPL